MRPTLHPKEHLPTRIDPARPGATWLPMDGYRNSNSGKRARSNVRQRIPWCRLVRNIIHREEISRHRGTAHRR